MLELGQACEDITPQTGAIMDGFAARPGPSTRIRDRLWVRALCFRKGGRQFVILAFDLIGVRGRLLEAVNRALLGEAALAAGSFMTASIHTHAGPSVGVLQDLPVDERYVASVAKAAVAAVRRAEADCSPVELDVVTGGVSFPVNRRLRRDGKIRLEPNYEGSVDRSVRVMRAFRRDGSPKAVIAHASCHPITLPGSNTAISADYPSVMYARVEQTAHALPVYLLGSAGDVNPIVLPGESPEEALDRSGGELARVVSALLEAPRSPADADDTFAWSRASVEVPLSCPLPRERVEELAREYRKKADAASTAVERYVHGRFANWYDDLHRSIGPGPYRASVTAEIQLFLLRRDVLFVALPFEVLTYTAQDLLSSLEQLGFSRRQIFVTSCANGVHGYLPPAAALEEVGYECDDSAVWYGLPGWYTDRAESLVREGVVRVAEGLVRGPGRGGGGCSGESPRPDELGCHEGRRPQGKRTLRRQRWHECA